MATVAAGLLLLGAIGTVVSAPVSTYDQRQQGELNIHAQLDNIVIVLIPTSNFNLLNLASKTKFLGEKPGSGDKGDFLHFFQKPHKTDIDRYETVEAGLSSDNSVQPDEAPVPVITSHQVILHHEGEKNEEKEEEVVATVQEMKPDTTQKVTEHPKLEAAAEDNPIKEHSTVSETVQESVLNVSIPEELKDAVKSAEEEAKEPTHVSIPERSSIKPSEEQVAQKATLVAGGDPDKSPEQSSIKTSEEQVDQEATLVAGGNPGKFPEKSSVNPSEEQVAQEATLVAGGNPGKFPEKSSVKPSEEQVAQEATLISGGNPEQSLSDKVKKIVPLENSEKEEKVQSLNNESPLKMSSVVSESGESSSLKDLIRPVAEREEKPQAPSVPKKTVVIESAPLTTEPLRLVEATRKEKVIRYKPETKWAPELVDLLGPPRHKSRELEEKQRFAFQCSPGVWDTELKTCLMPGETRSRTELARFLEAMRFGIAIPAQ